MFRPDNRQPESDGPHLHVVFQRGQLVSDMRSQELCLLDEAVLRRGGWNVIRRHFMGYWRNRLIFALTAILLTSDSFGLFLGSFAANTQSCYRSGC